MTPLEESFAQLTKSPGLILLIFMIVGYLS